MAMLRGITRNIDRRSYGDGAQIVITRVRMMCFRLQVPEQISLIVGNHMRCGF